jgi:hypothetical protein
VRRVAIHPEPASCDGAELPRPYHSPSSIKLANRCEYAWALRYIEGRRPPDTEAQARGKAVHATLETWYLAAKEPDWQSFAGQIAHSGAHLLPHPEQCEAVHVERGIGTTPLVLHYHGESKDYWVRPTFEPGAKVANVTGDAQHTAAARAKGVPLTALDIGGVRWAGFIDLLAKPMTTESRRLGLPRGWLMADYKSSANIGRYALTPAELRADVQANLYAIDACERLDLDAIPARWLYLETKRVRRAKAVDVTLHRDDALQVIEPCNTRARELDSLTEVRAATKNPRACGDYGRTCEYHKSIGGPCDARRSVGSLVQVRVKKVEPMPLDPKLRARFQGLANKTAEAEADPEPEADAEGEAEAEAEGEAEAPPPPPPKLKAKPGPKPAAAAPAPSTAKPTAAPPKASKLATLAAKYDAKAAELAAIGAEIAALVGG